MSAGRLPGTPVGSAANHLAAEPTGQKLLYSASRPLSGYSSPRTGPFVCSSCLRLLSWGGHDLCKSIQTQREGKDMEEIIDSRPPCHTHEYVLQLSSVIAGRPQMESSRHQDGPGDHPIGDRQQRRRVRGKPVQSPDRRITPECDGSPNGCGKGKEADHEIEE